MGLDAVASMYDMAREFIPQSFEECTPDWLTRVLGSRGLLGDARVDRVEVETLGEGEGFMGSVARLSLYLDREEPIAPATLIAKLPTQDRFIKAQAEIMGLYEREILFYEEFASELPQSPPRCFYTAMDPNPSTPQTQKKMQDAVDRLPEWMIRILIPLSRFFARFSRRRYVMLLEDMAPARVGDQLAGGSDRDVEAMVHYLGRMHAHFWNSTLMTSRPWILSLDSSPRAINLMYRNVLPMFNERFKSHIGEDFRRLQTWLSEHGVEIAREFQRSPFTLVHADFRLDNVFFLNDSANPEAKIDGRDVVLFDWQIPVRGPGAYDLAYFLGSHLAPEAPAEREEFLLRLYHDQLIAEGVEGYDFEALRRDYDVALVLMVQRVTASFAEIEATNDRGRDLFEAWIERHSARIVGIDPNTLLTNRKLESDI